MSDGELAVDIRNIQQSTASIAPAPMPASVANLRHLKGLVKQDAQCAERTRKVLSKSLALLREPMPDTFLGRRTQPEFPKLEDD